MRRHWEEKAAMCISCEQYAQFPTRWKTFIVQCSYARAAFLQNVRLQLHCFSSMVAWEMISKACRMSAVYFRPSPVSANVLGRRSNQANPKIRLQSADLLRDGSLCYPSSSAASGNWDASRRPKSLEAIQCWQISDRTCHPIVFLLANETITLSIWLVRHAIPSRNVSNQTRAFGKNDDMSVEKVAIITAGGSGMGAEAAKRLAADGFKVAILSSSGKGEALAADLGGIGITGSNQNNDDLKRLVETTMDKWGRIDALVNSAGHGPRAPIVEITDEQWHTGLDIYLMNVIRPVRLVTPIMQAQKSGAIVNISTAWAFEPSSMFPTSAVFRAGLASYSKIYADTYAADGIRINNVLPGWIDSLPSSDERRDSVPMKRYGTSAEVAATISFLVSEGAGYITGQNLRVDGGITRAV